MPGPNTYKVIHSFTGSLGARWNEMYYTTGSTPTDVLYVPDLYKAARLWLLHPTCTLATITAADVNNNRITAMRRTNWSGQNPGPSGAPNYVSPAETSLVCQLVGANGGSRKIWLRGLPSYVVGNSTISGSPIFSGAINQVVSEIFTSLATAGFGIRTLIKSTKYQVASMAAGAAAGQTVVTYTVPNGVAPPTFQAGNAAFFSLADKKTLPGLKGTFTVLNVGANTITIRYQLPNNAAPANNLGYVRQQTYNNVSVFDPKLCVPAYWGSHDTRVFSLHSRGAKRAERIRSLA